MHKNAKKDLLTLIGGILMVCAIAYGGPCLSSVIDNNYRKKIDRNGLVTKAVVVSKSTHKGRSVNFRYYFKDIQYTNNEQNDSLYKALDLGDIIDILIDSTNPSASYIIK